MKVLQVFNRYLEKGGEEIWVDEFEKLAGGDHNVETLFFDSHDWQECSKFDRIKQARWIWNNPSSRAALANRVRQQQSEALVFHNVLPVGSFGLYDEGKKLGLPIYQYTHNFRPFSPSGTLWANGAVEDSALRGSMKKEVLAGAWGESKIKTALIAGYFKKFLRTGMVDHVTHWLAISNFMRDCFISAGIPDDRISTLRHCRKVDEIPAPGSDENYYLFLGRFVPEKGCLMLIKAWKKLFQNRGENCPPLVLGGTGPCEAEMKKLASDCPAIRFAGFVSGDEKVKLLRGCRALLAPSIWWEPLGLVGYDAFQYGKPLIAARSGGLTEIVEEGKGGLLHRAGDLDDFCEKIAALESLSGNERVDLGMRGHRWMITHANPGRWRETLNSILGKTP